MKPKPSVIAAPVTPIKKAASPDTLLKTDSAAGSVAPAKREESLTNSQKRKLRKRIQRDAIFFREKELKMLRAENERLKALLQAVD